MSAEKERRGRLGREQRKEQKKSCGFRVFLREDELLSQKRVSTREHCQLNLWSIFDLTDGFFQMKINFWRGRFEINMRHRLHTAIYGSHL